LGYSLGSQGRTAALLEARDGRRFNDYAVSVHFCRDPPHLWVTASPQNLVYRGYKGNKMTIILGMISRYSSWPTA
jgi:hypothetical protein